MSLEVVGVKQMMRLFTQRLAEVLLVQLDDVRILM